MQKKQSNQGSRRSQNRINSFNRATSAIASASKNGGVSERGEIIKRGRVVEALPNALFKVEYEDKTSGLANLGGKMKVYKIRVLVGDMVEAIIDPYSKKGRIVKRG